MSFLTPLFLLGALAVAVPVVFHLIRRTTRDKVPFSSLMFLRPSPPRVTRRSRLENILLLLLRCTVFCLLALGFARPFLQAPMAANPDATGGTKIVLLLDVSASMRREGVWEQALSRAETILSQTKAGDRVAVATFGRMYQPVVSFEEWTATALSERASMAGLRLRALQPGWSSTRLGPALLSALEDLEELEPEEAQAGVRRIILISDLQAGAKPDGLQGFEWPEGVNVNVETVRAIRPTNAGLQLLPDLAETRQAADQFGPRIRVVNALDSEHEQFLVRWQGANPGTAAGTPLELYVPPGQNRIVQSPAPPPAATGQRLELSGDDEPFDNTAWFIPPAADRVRLLFLGGDAADNPNQMLYYLKRAFPETRLRKVDIVSRGPTEALTAEDVAATKLVVVSGAQTEARIGEIRERLAQGRTVLMVLRAASDAATLAAIAGTESLRIEEAPAQPYAMFGRIDFTHPLFAPLADPRYNDFTRIHFWKHRQLETNGLAGVRVLAEIDDGHPLLLQMPSGQGQLLLLASGWHPADSQLALSSKFVPLLHALLELSGAVQSRPAQFEIGDEVKLGLTNRVATAGITVRRPDGTSDAVSSSGLYPRTDLPGFYTAQAGSESMTFAVNLAPEESRTEPMPVEDLENLGVPLGRLQARVSGWSAEARESLHAAELENRQKLWRWLMVAALAFLILESWLAGRLSRVPAA